jgi:transposase-like protein
MDDEDRAICLRIAKQIGDHMTKIHIDSINGFLMKESKGLLCPSCKNSHEVEVLWKIDDERQPSRATVKCHACGFRSEDRVISGAEENSNRPIVEIRAFLNEFKKD